MHQRLIEVKNETDPILIAVAWGSQQFALAANTSVAGVALRVTIVLPLFMRSI